MGFSQHNQELRAFVDALRVALGLGPLYSLQAERPLPICWHLIDCGAQTVHTNPDSYLADENGATDSAWEAIDRKKSSGMRAMSHRRLKRLAEMGE